MCKANEFFVIHAQDGFAEPDGGETPPPAPQPPVPPTPPAPSNEPPKIDLETADLEALAAVNPAVAEVLKRQKEAEEAQAAAARQKAEEEGRLKDVIAEQDKKLAELQKKAKDNHELATKYAETVKNLVDETIKKLPEDKRNLVPSDYSPRQKLEYLTANAKWLGISPVGAGDGAVPPSTPPPGDERSQVIADIEALHNKSTDGTITALERELLYEKSKKLKELNAAVAK